jgi:hypothetical protein
MAAEGTAERLSAYVHVLRALVHLGLGWLPSEPRLEVKRALARHAHEDARSLEEIRARLHDLPDTQDLPGAPAGTLRDVLARAARADDADEYRRIAYGALKPTLVELLREHRDAVDPLLDEPTLEVLATALARQSRHLDELPPGEPQSLSFTPEVEPGGEPELPIVPAPEHPARDPWTREGAGARGLHEALNQELLSGEILARAAHEFHDTGLARLVHDRLRHTAALEAAGAQWGVMPVDTQPFRDAADRQLAERIAIARDLARAAAAMHPPLRDDLTPLERL